MKTFVLSLGGSIVVPDDVDCAFLAEFRKTIDDFLSKHDDVRFIFVVGGGATARKYQNAVKRVLGDVPADRLDWVGIRATHINAEVVNNALGSVNPIVTNPMQDDLQFDGRILVAGGWKPGFSTDTDSVYLAKRFGAGLVLNLSNIDKVYTADPRTDKNARPIDDISWRDFIRDIVGEKWVPGANVPFDPVASKFASENGIDVICANGRDLGNLVRILGGDGNFTGTRIHG